jgi:hypothetical protein
VAAIQDVFSRRIVGWGMADHMRSELVVDALQMALGRRRPAPGLIHHSDQGSQFVWLAFGQAARAAGIAQSMGSRGDCYDNAVAESFFATSSKSSSTAARGRRRRSCEPRRSTPSRSSGKGALARPAHRVPVAGGSCSAPDAAPGRIALRDRWRGAEGVVSARQISSRNRAMEQHHPASPDRGDSSEHGPSAFGECGGCARAVAGGASRSRPRRATAQARASARDALRSALRGAAAAVRALHR